MNKKQYLYWIDLTKCPRFLSFPFPVDTVGMVLLNKDQYSGKHEGGMEFTIRLNSEEGVAIDKVEDTVYKFDYPHFMIQREGKQHEYRYDKPRESFFIIYNPKYELAFEAMGISSNMIGWKVDVTEDVINDINEIRGYFSTYNIPGNADKIDGLCLSIITKMLVQNKKIHDSEENNSRIHQIARELQSNYMKNINFNEIAKENGMSRRTFFRYWNKEFNETPQEFLTKIRLTKAAGFLSLTNLSISEIALNTGFSDTSYFTHKFKEFFNETPLVYRKKKRSS